MVCGPEVPVGVAGMLWQTSLRVCGQGGQEKVSGSPEWPFHW